MARQRVVIVTGASSGIGEATARALVADGTHVVGVARRKERLEQVARELRGSPGSLSVVVSDITSPGAAPKVIDQVVAESGHVDGLVNNAGIMLLGPVETTDPDEWDQMLEINVRAVLRMTSAAIPHLLRAAGEPNGVADIVNISSTAGRNRPPGRWGVRMRPSSPSTHFPSRFARSSPPGSSGSPWWSRGSW